MDRPSPRTTPAKNARQLASTTDFAQCRTTRRGNKYRSYLHTKQSCNIPRRTMYRIKKSNLKNFASSNDCNVSTCEPVANYDSDIEVDMHSMQDSSKNSSDQEEELQESNNEDSCRPTDEELEKSVSENDSDISGGNLQANHISGGNLQANNDGPMLNLTNLGVTHLQVDDLTKKSLLCLALKQRHHLTDTACNDMLSLINLCANGKVVPKNKYELKNILDKYTNTEIHHICKNCNAYIGILKESVEYVNCEECDSCISPKSNIKLGHFFIHLSLADQLKVILESHTEQELGLIKDKPIHHTLADVCDGIMYKKAMKHNQDLSISFSCDGVPVFSSSGFSIWPILCTVNEFSPNARKKNVMLTSLWFGKNKPEMNNFLKPFVAESKILAENGLSYVLNGEATVSKVFVLIGVCDSVARPLLQCSTQFNGAYGCGFCLHPGETVHKGKGHTRVYPHEANTPLRTHLSTVEHMRIADMKGRQSEFGIKHTSILLQIPKFDIVEGLIPDYMHSVLLGICRQFVSLWFDSKNHEQEYYIGNQMHLVDDILLSYKPPLFISRTPRSLNERKFWKAHEWYSWLLYYSIPTLKGILPDKYVYHWGWLAHGIYILLQNNVTKSEVVQAERILIHFVQEVENLYGKENVSFNVHLCEHLPRSVFNWGPLWAHSAFLYEDYNSELLKSVRSSNGVPLQIVDIFVTKIAMLKLNKNIQPSVTCEENTFLSSMASTGNRPIKNCLYVSDTVKALGLPKNCVVFPADFHALQKIHVNINRTTHVSYYNRVVINHEMFHCKNYNKVQKRNSYTVVLRDENIFSIKTFLVYANRCFAIGKYFDKTSHGYYSKKLKHFTDVSCMIALNDVDDNSAIDVASILKKVVFLGSPNPHSIIVCVPPNNLEMLL